MVKLFNHYCLFSTHILTSLQLPHQTVHLSFLYDTSVAVFSFYSCVRVISNNQTTDSALCYLKISSAKEISLLCFNLADAASRDMGRIQLDSLANSHMKGF